MPYNTTFKIICSFFMLLLLNACTGGGGGDGGGGGGSANLLPLYHFVIAGVDDGITLEADEDGDGIVDHTFRINPDSSTSSGIIGSVSCNTTTEDCYLSSIDTGAGVDFFDLSATAFGDLQIRVNNQILLSGPDTEPHQGSYQVISSTEGTITVTAVTTPSAGVQIDDDGLNKGFYTWTQLGDFEDNTSDPVLLLAQGGLDILGFMLDQMDFGTDGIDQIGTLDEQGSSSFVDMCRSFGIDGLMPPTGYLDQGMLTFSWLDDNNSGDLGPGDSFKVDFDSCRDENDSDPMYHGTIDLISYTMVRNANDTITRMGFEGSSGGKTGGVFFDNFRNVDICVGCSTNTGLPATLDSVDTLNGGFTLVFSEP